MNKVVLFGRGRGSGRGVATAMLFFTTILRMISVCCRPQEEALVMVVLSSVTDVWTCVAILHGECVLDGLSVSVVRRSVLGFVVTRRDHIRPSSVVAIDGRRAMRAGAPGGLLELRDDAGKTVFLVKYLNAAERAADIADFSARMPDVAVVSGDA